MPTIIYPSKKTYVSGNLEGSGSIIDPVVLKDQITVDAVTSSYLLNGLNVTASGIYSHAEGVSSVAAGEWSHAEGFATIANKSWSHSEGYETFADGIYSHAEGYITTASSNGSHAEGELSVAMGAFSHAEGGETVAAGNYSHAEGSSTLSYGNAAHTEGYNTTSSADYQHVEGVYNKINLTALHVVGNGTGPEEENRSNIIEIYTDKEIISGSLEVSSSLTSSNVLIQNNLTVNGTASINILNTVEANSLKIGDKYITILTGANTQAQLDGAGILFGSASADTPNGDQDSNAHIVYRNDGGNGRLEIFPGLKVSGSAEIIGNLTASSVTSSDVITNYINFKSSADPAWENGRVWYNNDTHELNYWTEVNGFNIKLGQQIVQRCQNNSSTTLLKGTIVHITGTTSTDTPRIVTASWDNDNLSANTLGLVAETIAGNSIGYVIVQGILKGVNTSAHDPGQILYLSSSGLTSSVKPIAPKHMVSIGQVVRGQQINGSIYVSIQNGYELGELHDVLTNGKNNGDLLVWDSDSSVWKNTKTLSGSYNISGAITASNFVGNGSALTGISSSAHTTGSLTGSGLLGNEIKLKDDVSIINSLKVGTSASATSEWSVSFGRSLANNTGSFASGYMTIASGPYSQAGNYQTTASGNSSHSEGFGTRAIGASSHAEGNTTVAYGDGSHSEGYVTNASGNYSHAEGYGTTASADYQHVQGKYNQTSSTALMIVGNGTDSPITRSNILEVYSDRMVLSGNLTFQNGKGIDFGTTSLSGENYSNYTILDDYEEGVWTPKLSGSFQTGSSTSSGTYTKVGNLVYLRGEFQAGSGIDGLGDIIQFLPYAVQSKTSVCFSYTRTNTDPDAGNGYLSIGNNIYCPPLNSGSFVQFFTNYQTTG